MELMTNIARVLILIAEVDPVGSNYPGAVLLTVPSWCVATPRLLLLSNYDVIYDSYEQ